MKAALQIENEALRQSWEQYDARELDTYLVSGVEDPRINGQSILTRGLIADKLWPGEFDEFIDAELRFGAVLTWILRRLEKGASRSQLLADLNAGDKALPKGLLSTYAWLQETSCPIEDYVTEALIRTPPDGARNLLPETALNAFRDHWHGALAGRTGPKLRLLEPACGSGNDYRFLDAFGLARFVDYRGFDIAPKNIRNASARFPDVPFTVGSVFDTGLPDESFECVVVHDLFEHLSPEGLTAALAEVLRVASDEAWLHFFNLADCPRHRFQCVARYHWNRLSAQQMKTRLLAAGSAVRVTRMADLTATRFGLGEHYNPEAVTLVVTK